MSDRKRLAFVCVQNAGRSQMSAAFARREVAARGLDWEILTGGTHPADGVHPEVVEVMAELDVDLSEATPQRLTDEELSTCDVVATMGCSTLSLDADTDVRDWALPDPHGEDVDRVREIRETVRERVADLFDELEAETATASED
jgi:protein-tyrosine-phosphatase